MTVPDEPRSAPPADAPSPPPASGPTPGARPDGTGYRAVIAEDGRTVWACAHVHFTEHSAKAHAEQQLQTMR